MINRLSFLPPCIYRFLWILFLLFLVNSSPFAQAPTTKPTPTSKPAPSSKPTPLPPIYKNQIGYLVSSPKIALVSSPTGLPFEIQEAETKKIVLSSMLKLTEPNDAASGSNLWSADFSMIDVTGSYLLNVPGIGSSGVFRIDNRVYNNLSRQSAAVFYLHRSGTALPKTIAEKWARGSCHNADGFIYSASPGDPIIHNATGGWFDGSDYGKYIVNGNFAAGMLLTLHEYLPTAFPDGSLQIPERANGVPDLLDECRWELEFILRMQNEEGGFYHKLTSLEPVAPVLPEKDASQRFLFPPSTAATAGACALLAKASRLYSPYDETFAATCLASARSAMQYLAVHPTDAGFENPPNVRTKTFRDIDDSDERFWAAIELFLTTGETAFKNMAIELEKQRIPLLSASGYWGNVMPLAIASILKTKPEKTDPALRDTAIKDLLSLANIIMETILKDGFRLSIKEGEFTWGSNGALLQNAFILILAHTATQQQAYRLAALDQLHAILGRNPLSMCFVTGFGNRSPKHPYHLISMTDKIEEPAPGLLVGGPNQTLGDSALKMVFPPEAAPATIYLDSEESISSNETDLVWNAVLAFMATYFSP